MIRIGLGLALMAAPAAAEAVPTNWPAEKCSIYAAAWNKALDMFGSDQMNYAFLAGNENFIAGGCSDAGLICPQSEQELDVANALSLAMINAGAASTFLPFNCPQPQSAADGWTGPGL
nr:hypothetical protein [uncultured Devosia sp.]